MDMHVVFWDRHRKRDIEQKAKANWNVLIQISRYPPWSLLPTSVGNSYHPTYLESTPRSSPTILHSEYLCRMQRQIPETVPEESTG